MTKIAAKGMKTVFCVARSNRGLTRVAAAVARDMRSMTDEMPCNIRVAGSSDIDCGACANAGVVIAAGIAGNDGNIDKYIDPSLLAGKRECYIIKLIRQEHRDVIIVSGSDKLGAEYGLLHISELAGVSPWHYFADVTPLKTDCVEIDDTLLNCTSKEPEIRLRGFFMNDEWPSLGDWVHEKFGGFNEFFYDHVFDLLLRLRGNFLWPAMWSAVFSEDGYAYPTACAELANDYGIIMGTSHHEPLFRAGEEFLHTMTDDNNSGYGKDWSYYSNESGLYEFWDYSVKRNRDFASLITVGMRGERDSKILGEDATLADNINLLKKTISDQKKILRENGLENSPKVLALYKEVEDYFYGDENTEGLSGWKELDDVMFLLSDDNYANTLTLPTDSNRDRAAGWGLYYHFDYHGEPVSYEWVNSTPITKAWEQLTMAHDHGIKDLWVANVGDLRPQELPLSYFMSLAFDYDVWSERNRTGDFLKNWTQQQFSCCDDVTKKDIADILNGYTRLNGDRRPESTHADTFSLYEEGEAVRELKRAYALEELVSKAEKNIPQERRDAFTGLVSFPALASANLRKMMIYSGMYNALCEMNVSIANKLHELVQSCIERDKELVGIYNNDIADGKWHNMMSSKHVDFVNWCDEGSDYPRTAPVDFCRTLLLSRDQSTESGSVTIPNLSSVQKNSEKLYLFDAENVTVKNEYDWIDIHFRSLGFDSYEYTVSVDWDKLDSDADGELVFICGDKELKAKIHAHVCNVDDIESGAYIESDGVISMEAEHFAKKNDFDDCGWEIIENYGKSLSAVKCLPNRSSFENAEHSPSLEYRFFIEHADNYTFTCVLAPTNNTEHGRGLRYALVLDDGAPIIVDSLPKDFTIGSLHDEAWCKGVLDNCRRCDTVLPLGTGMHTLKFCQYDAGIVLQKIEIALRPSTAFCGYRETARKK